MWLLVVLPLIHFKIRCLTSPRSLSGCPSQNQHFSSIRIATKKVVVYFHFGLNNFPYRAGSITVWITLFLLTASQDTMLGVVPPRALHFLPDGSKISPYMIGTFNSNRSFCSPWKQPMRVALTLSATRIDQQVQFKFGVDEAWKRGSRAVTATAHLSWKKCEFSYLVSLGSIFLVCLFESDSSGECD